MSLPLSRTSRYSVFDRPTLESHEDPGIFRDGKPHEKAIPGSTTGAICPQAKTEKDMWDQQQRYPSTERLYMLDTYQMSAGEASLLLLMTGVFSVCNDELHAYVRESSIVSLSLTGMLQIISWVRLRGKATWS